MNLSELAQEAQRLSREGLALQDIADVFGAHPAAIAGLLDRPGERGSSPDLARDRRELR